MLLYLVLSVCPAVVSSPSPSPFLADFFMYLHARRTRLPSGMRGIRRAKEEIWQRADALSRQLPPWRESAKKWAQLPNCLPMARGHQVDMGRGRKEGGSPKYYGRVCYYIRALFSRKVSSWRPSPGRAQGKRLRVALYIYEREKVSTQQ